MNKQELQVLLDAMPDDASWIHVGGNGQRISFTSGTRQVSPLFTLQKVQTWARHPDEFRYIEARKPLTGRGS